MQTRALMQSKRRLDTEGSTSSKVAKTTTDWQLLCDILPSVCAHFVLFDLNSALVARLVCKQWNKIALPYVLAHLPPVLKARNNRIIAEGSAEQKVCEVVGLSVIMTCAFLGVLLV